MIGEPTFAQGQRRVILSESERRVLGISKRIIEVKEDWIEADLDPRWVAAFRVIRDDRGLPVFGEVRVFPQGKRPTTWRGRWSAEVTGSSAQAPRGGITARLLRRIQTGPSEALLAKASRLFARDAQREKGPLPPYLKDGAAPLLIAAGERVRRHPPTPGRGRRPEPDATYAKVADAYVTAFREHRRAPILDTAKRFQMSPAKVRMMIHTARRRGLLSEAHHGKAGGELTKQCVAILRSTRARQRRAEKGGRRRSRK